MSASEPCFLLSVVGQLEAAEFVDLDSLYSRYSFHHGPDWQLITGLDEGISQIAKTSADAGQQLVWNLPVEACFKSSNPFGSGLSDEKVAAACSAAADPVMGQYSLQHVMYRIRCPERSLRFYTHVLGMTLLKTFRLAETHTSLYLLGYCREGETVPEDPVERTRWSYSRPGLLQLSHSWGVDWDPQFKGYHHGNAEPGLGYGHIAISVPDVDDACAMFRRLHVPILQPPEQGVMKGIAFVQDPDGYWIQILSVEKVTRRYELMTKELDNC